MISKVSMLAFIALIVLGCGRSDSGSASGSNKSTSNSQGSNFIETLSDGINIKMIFVDGGTFTMGCTPEQGDECSDYEKPAHSVTLGDFYIGKYEVTQELWGLVMAGTNRSAPSFFKGGNLPVERVSYKDIVDDFLPRLNRITGRKFRLPTEAEWEYAARGGAKSKGYKYSGSNNIDDVAWYFENSGDVYLDESKYTGVNYELEKSVEILSKNNNRTHLVGIKEANELGIHDMTGNVWEWCSDWFEDYTAAAKDNPKGPKSGIYRVYRGGSCYVNAKPDLISGRSGITPSHRNSTLGFRLALSP